MPLPMVHLSVARKISEAIKFTDTAAFYLGSISPDAVHKREASTRDDKQRSHLGMHGGWRLDDNRDETFSRLSTFISNAPIEDSDFYLGYAVHLLTDTCWNSLIIPIFYERFCAAGGGDDIARNKRYYNDTDLLDIGIYNTAPWRGEVWELLSSAMAVTVPELVTADEVRSWNVRTLHWFEQDFDWLTTCEFLQLDDIERFVQAAADECIQFLKIGGTQCSS